MIDPQKFGLSPSIPVTFLTPEQAAKIPGASSGYNAVFKIGENRVRYELLKAGKVDPTTYGQEQQTTATVTPEVIVDVVETVVTPVEPVEVVGIASEQDQVQEPVVDVVETVVTPVEPVEVVAPVQNTKKKK